MDNLTRQALAYVNDVRRRLDLQPVNYIVPGRTATAQECPMARSIVNGTNYSCSIYEMCMVWNTNEFGHSDYVLDEDTPANVVTWIQDYDSGRYPEYYEC